MNEKKFTPIFQRIGVPYWRVSHLSDIPYIVSSDISASGDNSPAQQDLSAMLSGSAAAFAYTEDPTISPGRTFKDWPVAYQNRSRQALEKEYPDEMSLYVVGGPCGSGPATIASGKDGAVLEEREKALA